ncbi:hypothetical protein FisN_19Lh185 [Fistulifera solaris]|uniref:Palmitoyltransferase n=1 Tax=Fistulifera solaris TaxID=1519565 RepID=A0A1Z5J6U0_FISSO|nr:hypothetical protein FisN_19Lh185 [Fistulifera solaris]|eukprot:GAX09717.1 hypothetical protein FisN_19Lh185 [Fistulifera solaris]
MMTPSSPTNDYSTRQRQRQDLPYRDDPNAPPRLESYTFGGLGPLHALPEKSKQLSLPKRLWNAASTCCQPHLNNNDNTSYYYTDTFNDLPWTCSIGTSDEHGIWLNRYDPAGTIMALIVWILMGYSSLTMTWLAATGGIPVSLALLYTVLTALALACHVKTSLTDPGAVPPSAVPTAAQRHQADLKLSMCSQCQTFKPPHSHHCRICNRCISRMDHHCPWMNNCIGAGNLKHFVLFLVYTWICSVTSLLTFGWNYFFCAEEACVFTVVLTQLVRVMTLLSIGAFLFTSSMIMNVLYGILTGIGTIDRLKKKATNTMDTAVEDSIPLAHIFGQDPWYWWWLPTDPQFPDYDRVMGFSTPQRLLREQMLWQQSEDSPSHGMSV